MGCCCSDCCCKNNNDSSQDRMVSYASHDTEHQGTRYLPPINHPKTKKIGSNDYHTAILNLDTLHGNFMDETRRYQILVYRGNSFGQHHYVVVSDGVNQDITLELTVAGEKSGILSGKEKVIAAVNIFRGRKSELEDKGVVECSLHMLTEIAADIIRRNTYYNLFNNNCQDFCNMFLDALNKQTYMTDPRKAMVGGTGTGIISSMVMMTAAGYR